MFDNTIREFVGYGNWDEEKGKEWQEKMVKLEDILVTLTQTNYAIAKTILDQLDTEIYKVIGGTL